jgi:hypothetical protein
MAHDANIGIYFWAVLLLYGVMYAMTPNAVSAAGFFRGADYAGRAASRWMLTASIFISWIFAKSVTNAAHLGAAYGVVGVRARRKFPPHRVRSGLHNRPSARKQTTEDTR